MKKMINGRNLAICSVLTASMLTGCANISSNGQVAHTGDEMVQTISVEEDDKTLTENGNETEKIEDEPAMVNTKITEDFDKELMEFVEESGFAEQNYMVSPTSFRAALALAVAGADTETKEELIRAMGFNDMDEVNAWYASVSHIIEDFDTDIRAAVKDYNQNKEWYPDDTEKPEGALILLNSIWHNSDRNGKFGKEYVNYVEKNYAAAAYEENAAKITGEVNNWVKKGTNGLIPSISDDLSGANAVLVNTLYLKSSWVNCFESYATSTGTFTTAKGEKVEKEFMNQKERFRFYEDAKGKLIVLPLKGGVDAVFVLGDVGDVNKALEKAYYEDVIVKLPKFDVESSFNQKEFIQFLRERGAGLAFIEDADFSVMCPDTPWMIDDIIQKTRIKVNEDGLEAAAATAILMVDGALPIETKPKEFIADQPFKFYICAGEDDSEVLFCGQVVE